MTAIILQRITALEQHTHKIAPVKPKIADLGVVVDKARQIEGRGITPGDIQLEGIVGTGLERGKGVRPRRRKPDGSDLSLPTMPETVIQVIFYRRRQIGGKQIEHNIIRLIDRVVSL